MTDYVLTGLVKCRSELTGDIERIHLQLRNALDDLENLDKTIRQFAPDFQVETIRPKAFRLPADWADRGQMSRVILSILRQASEPMTTRDIALELLITRALDQSDVRLLKLVTKRVGVALRGQRDNGAVRAAQGPGQMVLWEVAR